MTEKQAMTLDEVIEEANVRERLACRQFAKIKELSE